MRSSSNKPLYYEHSGVVGVAGPVVMAATALATSVVVGAAFGIASKFNPIFYLDGVLAFFFGYGCGWVVGALGHKAKVRSEALTWITGIGLGLLCTYTGWVFWIYTLSDYQRMLLGEPETVWAIIGRINAMGAWSVFGWQPTGYPLWAFWALELAVITFGAMKGVLLKLGQSVNIYCEDCRRWSEEVFTSPPLKPVEDGEALKSALEAGDFSALESLYPQPEDDPIETEDPGAAFTRLLVMACPQCENLHVLDVTAFSVDGDGDKAEELIVDNLLVQSRVTHDLQHRFAGYVEPEPEKKGWFAKPSSK